MNERGSASLNTLTTAVLLSAALAVAIFWSAISITRHRLDVAADLTALSAADTQARPQVTSQAKVGAVRPDPCRTAARIAATHRVDLTFCTVGTDSVTVEVATRLDVPLVAATLTSTSRAGPAP